jgi:hypothetical protein
VAYTALRQTNTLFDFQKSIRPYCDCVFLLTGRATAALDISLDEFFFKRYGSAFIIYGILEVCWFDNCILQHKKLID